jgi:hypothetical protein
LERTTLRLTPSLSLREMRATTVLKRAMDAARMQQWNHRTE